MAVALFGTISSQESNSDPADLTHTIESGESDVLLVSGSHKQGSGADMTSVIWDPSGDNETLTEAIDGNDGTRYANLSYRTNPANQDDSSYTLRFDYNGGAGAGRQGGLNFSGVDQTTSVSNAASENAGSAAINVSVTTNSDSDDQVVDACCGFAFSGTLTVGGGQTSRIDIDTGGNVFGMSTEGGGSTPTEMDWTLPKSGTWASSGMLINAAAGGGAGPSGHGKLLSRARNKLVHAWRKMVDWARGKPAYPENVIVLR